ncbi:MULTISPECIES: HNH endonuclease [Brevibacillus]|uniref:HNH endonuclease n=1 Tax=Brevibacillus TaxID=55080 RepID=UPI003158C31B
MFETLASPMLEVARERTTEDRRSDLPAFARELTPRTITSFEQADEPIRVRTINEEYNGKEHPDTGIRFVEKTVYIGDKVVVGVFPEFPSVFEMKLDESLYLESDAKQFRRATEALREEIAKNPELRSKFSDQQIEQIHAGRVPEGYVWHHSERPGVLQLVDREFHEETRHTGGRSLWGGGQSMR